MYSEQVRIARRKCNITTNKDSGIVKAHYVYLICVHVYIWGETIRHKAVLHIVLEYIAICTYIAILQYVTGFW